MQKILIVWAAALLLLPATLAWSGEHRLGGGVNYWVALEDLDGDDVGEDGFSYLFSYQCMMEGVGVELDVELLPDRFDEDAVAPAAWFLLGKTLYAGAGIGIVNSDGDFGEAPFFPPPPRLHTNHRSLPPPPRRHNTRRHRRHRHSW